MTTATFPINFIHSANLLFSTRFAGITINDPDTFTASGAWRHITGIDSITKFSHTDLAAAPLCVQPAGGGSTGQGGYGIYYINQVTTPGYATNDLAGLEDKCQTTTGTQTIRGVTSNYIKTNWLNTGVASAYQTQSWYAMQRDLTIANDLPTLCFREWVTLQDHAPLLDANNRYRYLIDIKTNSLSPGGGDNRVAFGIIRSNAGASLWHDEDAVPDGTLGWVCHGDNNANRADWNTPSFPKEEFFRVKNFSVPIPVNEAFEIEFYWKRATSYTDHDTGRLRIVMRKQDCTEYVLFDINRSSLAAYDAAHPNAPPIPEAFFPRKNIHMGICNNKVQRIFFFGCYFGGKANQSVSAQISSLEVFDDIPYYLPPP